MSRRVVFPGGVVCQGGSVSRMVSAKGVSAQGVSAQGGVCPEADTPAGPTGRHPPEQDIAGIEK